MVLVVVVGGQVAAALLHSTTEDPLRSHRRPPLLALLALRGLRQPHPAGGGLELAVAEREGVAR